MWIKGKQNIPKKYLPVLEEIFKINREYFSKDLTEIDRLEIQKEKLKHEIEPIINNYEEQFSIGEGNDIIQKPIYNKEEINTIERNIEKAKLTQKFKEALDIVDNNPHMESYKIMVELMEKVPYEIILKRTIEALGHYYEVIPNWVSSDDIQDEFEEDIFEIFENNEYDL
ncbi:hypothetical protein ANS017_03630 [Paraclostridium bifermentans]|nr:hypothetical protein [Paraclostridium bifermentans]GKZ08979.1 hypothetical protein ANS017_03630 [Paraclostridium bifermentans]